MVFLGVDGGGTGCRAAVADAAGRSLGTAKAGSANIMTDFEGARTNILDAAARALAASGHSYADAWAVLGLAGANVEDTGMRLAQSLPFAQSRVETDAVIALKGALHDRHGIAATIGTGAVYACQRGGKVRMIGGWGFNLGDEGSGAWIGREALAQLCHAQDGLVPFTPFVQALRDQIGGPERAVAFAHKAVPADYGRFAKAVVAAADDPVAAAILAAADGWIGRAIDHLQGDDPVPVCFLGGLGAVFASRLAHRYPGLIRTPEGSALDGAVWLARTSFGHTSVRAGA